MENIIESMVITYGTRSWHMSGNLIDEPIDLQMLLETSPKCENPQECYNFRVSSRNYGETTAYEISPGIEP